MVEFFNKNVKVILIVKNGKMVEMMVGELLLYLFVDLK